MQGLNPKDDKSPYTDSYSFTIAQTMPWSAWSKLPTSATRATTCSTPVRVAAITSTRSRTERYSPFANPTDTGQRNVLRPYKDLGDTYIVNHDLYQNFNAFQMTWLRSKGRYNINANYTFGKTMGILNNGVGDQFNLANNYGVAAQNRTHIFNMAYSVEMGNFTKSKLGGGFINGWQLSGIAQWQSGANLTGNAGYGAWNMELPSGVYAPGYAAGANVGITNASILGTTDMQLNPVVTCNPASGLGSHQYINGSCYQMPGMVRGSNGPTAGPTVYGPAVLQRRPRAIQELPDGRIQEAATALQRVQLPEPPAMVVPDQHKPDAELQCSGRQPEHQLRYSHAEAGPPHRPGCNQVLLLRTA